MSSLNTIFSTHLNVKLSINKFYRHESSCKLEKMLENILANI